ncbi:MAG: T9SS type A sorting domain-containing protein [Bacteroidales bacterium]|jgi:hypothetical protein|nr:T9SS type A sorting domain-containing protein [Bacteroidales bacterium]
MRKILICVILFVVGGLNLQAQNLHVHPVDGGEPTVFSLGHLPKITFNEGTKKIETTTTTQTFQLSDVQRLTFKPNNSTNIATTVETHGRVSLHPNPVENELTLNIQIPTQGLAYRIFDMNGKLQRTNKIHSETTTINMQNFRKGTYILHIERSGQFIQSFKIVKQ